MNREPRIGGHGRVSQRLSSGRRIEAIGLRPRPFQDLYHFLITSTWPTLFVVIVVVYLAVNAVFALGYLALGNGIANARPGSFADAFFFSVQTMATVGYGQLVPQTLGANLLAVFEVVVGAMGLALMTGLVFAKFARPTARVVFSRVAVVSPYDGVRSLVFRMANARASQIVEAHVTVVLLRNETTAEGESVRRMRDIQLRRDRSAAFALTWTAVHPIAGDSPLLGEDAASLAGSDTEIVVSLTGFDESLSQTVQARHSYRQGEVLWDVRLKDILGRGPGGERTIHYRDFHEVEPLDGEGSVGRSGTAGETSRTKG